nr:putative retrotransposon protein [Tanacetum cinerariifolium]
MKVKESLNVTFDETPPPPKTSPLEDDELVEEEEAIEQTALAIFTTKVEYVSARKACQQALWMKQALIDYGVSGRAVELEEIQDVDTSPSENNSEIPIEVEGFEPPQKEAILVRRSARTHQAPERLCLNVKVKEHSLGDLNEPTNYKATMLDLKSNKWLDAMNAKMQSMKDNQVWCLVDLPPNGFIDRKHPKKVCKLQRSIYGLKQASKRWNKRFDEEIKWFGFEPNLDEPCVYQKASGSNVTFLILYVDDIMIMGIHIPSLQSVKSYPGKCFSMKDLGKAAFILRIKIYRDRTKRLTD